MADSLDGLGGLDIFPFVPNWTQAPDSQYAITRYYYAYPGTANIIEELSSDVPNDVELTFLLEDKEDEYDFIDFFHTHKGRRDKFWVKDPRSLFVVKDDVGLGSSTIKCYNNYAHNVMRGDERIYIDMRTGDLVTRELTSVDYLSVDDSIVLSLDTVLDRDVDKDNTNIYIISKLLLCRFGADTIEVRAESNTVSTAGMRFHELVKEYTDQ